MSGRGAPRGANVDAAPFVPGLNTSSFSGQRQNAAGSGQRSSQGLSLEAKNFIPTSPGKMQNGPPSDIHVGASEFRPSSAIGNDKSGAGRARALSQAATAAVFVPGGGHGQGTQHAGQHHAQRASQAAQVPPGTEWSQGRAQQQQRQRANPNSVLRPQGAGSFVPRSKLTQPHVASIPQSGTAAAGQPAQGGGRGRGDAGRGRGRGRGKLGAMASPSPFTVAPGRAKLAARFMDETLRQELMQRRVLASAQMLPEEMAQAGLQSDVIEGFHSFWPLEDLSTAEEGPSSSLGVYSVVFKATASVDGQPYCLRRVNGRQVVPAPEMQRMGMALVERWKPLGQHPGLAVPRHVLITSDMDSVPSLVFVHDLHGGASTLEAAHMQPVTDPATGALVRNLPSEQQIWSYVAQLAAALHAAHSHGLPVRPASLDPSKVLLTVMGRVRIASLGVVDILRGDLPPPGVQQAQALFAQDLAALGQLLLSLMCAGVSQGPSLDAAAQSFSPDLVGLAASLMEAPAGGGIHGVEQLVAAISGRMCVEFGSLGAGLDRLTGELEREMENGRMARLLIKLGMVASRPPQDLPMRPDAGDPFLIGLLQDFLFAQVSESGTPALDWGHVLEALAKLDAGVPERVTLVPRDEQSLVVASYADLRAALEQCYGALLSMSLQGRAHGGEGSRG